MITRQGFCNDLAEISDTCPVQNANVGGYTSRGFVEVLAASQSPSSTKWFQGTADAVRQYLWLFENAMRDGVEDFLILSGMLLANTMQLHLAMLQGSG